MKKIFYAGLVLLLIFEVMNVYFIMPMPGSQRMNSIAIAYSLYRYRWIFRIIFLLMIIAGTKSAFQTRMKWIPVVAILPLLVVIWMSNFKMNADSMFLQPRAVIFAGKDETKLNDSTIVVAVEYKGQAKAYPMRYIIYHHQVRDSIAGKPIMVTYCSVCRTGRVFEPMVNGKLENFRLVGMDHFNAMFEDETTKSWWRQATGEAITGSLKGTVLPEVESVQLTAGKFFNLHPFGKIMRPDEFSELNYDTRGRYESGRSRGELTRTDTGSWKDKSWVVGVIVAKKSKAWDWKKLASQRLIQDQVGGTPLLIAISEDSRSFAAFERPAELSFTIHHDTLIAGDQYFGFDGKELKEPFKQLKKITAYQEFWHSWKTFHPDTEH